MVIGYLIMIDSGKKCICLVGKGLNQLIVNYYCKLLRLLEKNQATTQRDRFLNLEGKKASKEIHSWPFVL